jgi:hypothetical protein
MEPPAPACAWVVSSLAGSYGEPPGRVGEAPSQRSPVSNGVASFCPEKNDRPLAKVCIPAVSRGIVQEHAVAVPEPVQTNTLAVDPHLGPICVGTPPRLEAPLGDVPEPIPDEYPAGPRKCRTTDAHTSSRTQHVRRAVVTKARHVGVLGDALHHLHSIDGRARINRFAADYLRRRALSRESVRRAQRLHQRTGEPDRTTALCARCYYPWRGSSARATRCPTNGGRALRPNGSAPRSRPLAPWRRR